MGLEYGYPGRPDSSSKRDHLDFNKKGERVRVLQTEKKEVVGKEKVQMAAPIICIKHGVTIQLE